MDSTVIILIVVIVVLLLGLGAAGVMLSRKRRSDQLQEHYGPEYERSVRESGDRRSAEAELTSRERRVQELDIRDLRPEERAEYRSSWNDIQQGFVDDPVRSVHAADRLVVDIMKTRGYPVDDFDRRAEDISVAHPDVVQHYRDARAVRDATDGGQVDTDQQRRAVTSYRSLVDALIGKESHSDTDRSDADRGADSARTDGRSPAGNGQLDGSTDARHADDRAADAGYADDPRHTEDRTGTSDRYRDDRPTTGGSHTAETRPTSHPQTEEHTR